MKNKTTLSKLYFLLASVDGTIKPKEEAIGDAMCSVEGIEARTFAETLLVLKTENRATILNEAIKALKSMSRAEQIRCIAWMCVIANADGFMEKVEWQLIYKIYHKELSLLLEEVLSEQKKLSAACRPYLMTVSCAA